MNATFAQRITVQQLRAKKRVSRIRSPLKSFLFGSSALALELSRPRPTCRASANGLGPVGKLGPRNSKRAPTAVGGGGGWTLALPLGRSTRTDSHHAAPADCRRCSASTKCPCRGVPLPLDRTPAHHRSGALNWALLEVSSIRFRVVRSTFSCTGSGGASCEAKAGRELEGEERRSG